MASSGPNSPGTNVNDTSIGTWAWVNPGNAASSDNVRVTSAVQSGATVVTNYLKSTNFGFSIPSGATIDGIVVEIEHKSDNATAFDNVIDATVKIVKGGTISGTNLADIVTKWPTTEAYASYGSSSNLWGLSWTYSDINSSTFGVAVSATLFAVGKSFNTAYIDHIRITVYYTAGGGSSQSALLTVSD